MPFIEEAKYQLMHEEIDAAKLRLEESEKKVTSLQKKLKQLKRKSRIVIVVLCLLFGISSLVVYSMYENGSLAKDSTASNSIDEEEIDIDEIRAEEARRVIDSITNIMKIRSSRSNQKNVSLNDEIANIRKNGKGKTVFSVQIGAFSERKFPLLSDNFLAGITSKDPKYYKYSLGVFTSLIKAKKLKSELIKIGFKDAFVASYINGKRQRIIH